VKELNHFSKPDHLDRLPEYRNNFPDTLGVKYYMEATPHYFRLANRYVDIAQNIKNVVPNARIIVMFRDPVSRYESAYIHHMMKGRLPYRPVIEEFTDEHIMLTLGRYSEILRHWLQIWPDIGLHLYDDVKSDKVGLVNRIMGFLELENDITPEMLEFKTNAKELKVERLSQKWATMPTLSPDLYRKLAAYYADGIKELEDMLGRDLQHWAKRHT